MAARVKAAFVEPMLLQPAERLPDDGERWTYELKLDGYRAIAFKSGRRLSLRSRNDNDFSVRYASLLPGLHGLPDETVIDGEVIAVDATGRPSFADLQDAGATTPLLYYVFDVMVLEGQPVAQRPHTERRMLLEERVLPALAEPVRYTGELRAPLSDLVASVRELGLEGLVAKRRDSRYEPGQRSGAWLKQRVSRGQEFVIGGYTVGTSSFDALVVGYYDGNRLLYAARVRNGFTPALRAQLFRQFRTLQTPKCPFINLPEARSGRWGEGLTMAKMAQCRWLSPALVARIEFVEWTGDHHLRHPRFVGLRGDKDPRQVRREQGTVATSGRATLR